MDLFPGYAIGLVRTDDMNRLFIFRTSLCFSRMHGLHKHCALYFTFNVTGFKHERRSYGEDFVNDYVIARGLGPKDRSQLVDLLALQ